MRCGILNILILKTSLSLQKREYKIREDNAMRKIKELSPDEVYRSCDLSEFRFRTTEEIIGFPSSSLPPWFSKRFKTTNGLAGCEGFIGQERAVNAIYFGLGIEHRGYNLYLAGPPGVGKTSSIKAILSMIAQNRPTPGDWCYVYNFEDPNVPKTINLPTGMGKTFKKDMEDLLESLKSDISKAFESKQYEEEKQRITNESQRQREALFGELQKRAAEGNMQIQFTPTGIVTIPLFRGKPITQEEYNTLEETYKEEIRKNKERIDEEVGEIFKRVKNLEKETAGKLKELEKRVALFAVRDLLDNIREKYRTYPNIIDYLDMVQKHILENIDNFLPDKGTDAGGPLPFRFPQQKPTFTEYQVNVVIDNSNTEGAPVVFEPHPTYTNMFGSIEREARFGVLVTDFTMIHAGSLAKANGGYLVVEALDVLKYPFVWDSLKKALENEELRIEDVYQQYGLMSTAGLRPEPIKLNVKVIMEGSPFLLHQFYTYDEDFRKLFKVKTDFDSVVERTDAMVSQYACFVKSICDKEHLKHFDRSGVERVIEYCSRLAGDQNKLSTQFGAVSKVIIEASYWADLDDVKYVTRKYVEKAIDEKIYRSNMVEEKIREMITEGMILVDIEGAVVGQINGLAVYNLGDYAFGKPSRITCETFMGAEGVVNIERKASLSGNIHNKGVLILSGYLGAKYAQNKPLSLSATLCFEQSYEMIEGDSASAAELIALLSSLSGVPIKQGFAITGSVNQKGQIQPIGGANEKIEGFYHVCKAQGLTGKQGVIIPHQNVRNLMLKKEIVESVRGGKFHIYPSETIDQAIEILTEMEAGERDSNGKFKEGTVNYLVDKRLKELVEDFTKLAKERMGKREEGELEGSLS
jgi:lon-related putative ATP-dependent protease